MSSQPNERVVRWCNWEDTSREHLVLRQTAVGIVVDSAIVAGSYAVQYRVLCDPLWRVKQLHVRTIGRDAPFVLETDGEGHWRDGDAQALPQIDGAIDIDLPASPFTNTLPIRRLQLQPGQSADIVAAYVIFPDMTVQADPQRYTRIDKNRYRYESRDSDFTAEITVDEDGLVIDYPGLFKRI